MHSEFIQTFLVQKDWKKFGMAKISIPNLFKSVMVSYGLERNEICTFLGF